MLRITTLMLFIIADTAVNAELRKLIPKCYNSCLNPNGLTAPNCFCDSKCSLLYNDCCLDAPFRTVRIPLKMSPKNHCIFVHGENKNFWMVDTCKDSWSGHEHIREKCIKENIIMDEINDINAAVPVTNPEKGITYKNYYCSLCNDENAGDLMEWQVKALCADKSVTEADVLHNLTFVDDRKQWGVWKNDDSDFFECFLLYQRPEGVTNGIRECTSGMISTCPSSWKNIATRRKCKSYIDPVKFADGPIYRNIDCAVCHNKTREDFHCHYDVTRGSSAVMLSWAMPVDLSATGQWL